MASTTFTVMKSAIVVVAVASTMFVAVNAQATAPAPAPASAGSTILPTLMAPAVGMLVALVAGLKLW